MSLVIVPVPTCPYDPTIHCNGCSYPGYLPINCPKKDDEYTD